MGIRLANFSLVVVAAPVVNVAADITRLIPEELRKVLLAAPATASNAKVMLAVGAEEGAFASDGDHARKGSRVRPLARLARLEGLRRQVVDAG